MDRAVLCLRVIGCDETSWNIRAELERLLIERLLPGIDAEHVVAAIERFPDDGDLANGAGRWLFDERNWEKLARTALQRILSRIARYALASPRPINRARTLEALEGIGGAEALDVLRAALAGKIVVRRLSESQEGEPDGARRFQPGDSDLVEGASLAANAATALAKLRDKASLGMVRRLAATASGKERELLEAAVKRLEE